jgi:hypothetical protein
VNDDLCREDLVRLGRSGNPECLRKVALALGRVALGGIDYTQHEAAGTLWQVVTHAQLRSLGLGTCLVAEAERRIRLRELPNKEDLSPIPR